MQIFLIGIIEVIKSVIRTGIEKCGNGSEQPIVRFEIAESTRERMNISGVIIVGVLYVYIYIYDLAMGPLKKKKYHPYYSGIIIPKQQIDKY